ncbi:MAG: 50S ribosomal protein L23 [Lachnospiraceae bacterium]|nr:50S ribosomal protein L23 [Lachnospiraceae bacterium]
MANLTSYDIIKRPVVSEKSMNQMVNKKYTFIVHKDATKVQIKDAVEKLFEGAKVEKINTSNYDGKVRRRGFTVGRTNSYKKAIVTLKEGSKEIELFNSLSNK